mmetsp:Transcript_288/g.392  ORF Transcript_288/g.392 Transcript_288/m.392 type:complete len:282 (+) Transcript_288:448-1293(+)
MINFAKKFNKFLYFYYFFSVAHPYNIQLQENIYLLSIGITNNFPLYMKLLFIYDPNMYHLLVNNIVHYEKIIKKITVQFLTNILPYSSTGFLKRIKNLNIAYFGCMMITRKTFNLVQISTKIVTINGSFLWKSGNYIQPQFLKISCLSCGHTKKIHTLFYKQYINLPCSNSECIEKKAIEILCIKSTIVDISFAELKVLSILKTPQPSYNILKGLLNSRLFDLAVLNRNYILTGVLRIIPVNINKANYQSHKCNQVKLSRIRNVDCFLRISNIQVHIFNLE